MFEDIDKKQPFPKGAQAVPPPTPVVSKPPLEQSPFAVKSAPEDQQPGVANPQVAPIIPTQDEGGASGKLKIILVAVLILVVLGAIGGGVYYFFFRTAPAEERVADKNQPTNQANTNKVVNQANTNKEVSIEENILAKFEFRSELVASQFGDQDSDGLNTLGEAWFATKQETADSDGDGYNDGSEVKNGYHPAKVGAKIDLGGVEIKCQNFVGASAQDKFPTAEYRADVCSIVPDYYKLQEELGFVIDGTNEDYQNFGQAVIDSCKQGGFLSEAMLENCVNFLTEEVTFSWAS